MKTFEVKNPFDDKNPFDVNDLEKNTILCYNCCHKFKNKPLSLPIKYNEKTEIFEVFGTFCSWGCMKTYNTESNDSNMSYRNNLIFLLAGKMNNNFTSIKSAPPKYALKAFGGKLTIDEYRAVSNDNTTSYTILYPPLVPINPIVDKNTNFTLVSTDEASKTYNSYRPTIEENPLKMKREKKSENKSSQNTLEQSMGLNLS